MKGVTSHEVKDMRAVLLSKPLLVEWGEFTSCKAIERMRERGKPLAGESD